jgi:ATP-binding cassette, subfamily C (CFTR/MRP), member 4
MPVYDVDDFAALLCAIALFVLTTVKKCHEDLISFVNDCLKWQGALGILGIIFFVCAVNPWLFLCAVPMAAVFVKLRGFYMKFGRDIKRIEAVARSPIFSHFSSTLAGLPLIRVHNAAPRFIEEMNYAIDQHSNAFYMFMAGSRWLGIRIDVIAAVIIIVIAFTSIAVRDTLPAGMAALSIVYSLQLLLGVQWTVRQVFLL